jgi:CxxC-x17-CxxC domain-containing protein
VAGKSGEKTPEKQVERYETVCATCDQPITVPFKPDPARPAFCKECLKDYQRAMARARNEANQIKSDESRKRQDEKVNPFVRSAKERVASEVVSRPIREKAMSLKQISHIAPKKFKPQRKKVQVNLGEVRRLIEEK